MQRLTLLKLIIYEAIFCAIREILTVSSVEEVTCSTIRDRSVEPYFRKQLKLDFFSICSVVKNKKHRS